MLFPAAPNHSLTLQPSFLTVPAPKQIITDPQQLLPQLKLKITPHLIIPTPLISERVNGRRIEACVDVVVPVGGGVEVIVNVCEEGLEILDVSRAGLYNDMLVHLLHERALDIIRRVSYDD